MQAYLLVGIGGGIGAMLRYGYGAAAGALWPAGFPHATLTINVLGSLLMGVLAGMLTRAGPAPDESLRLFVAVGVLGGFTTFSAFSLDVISLVERGEVGSALLYLLGSVLGSVAALYVGLVMTRSLWA